MAKRPVAFIDSFTVIHFNSGMEEERKIAFAQDPSPTYKWGVLLPSDQTMGAMRPEGIWCKKPGDAEFAARSLRPEGGFAIARFHPEKKG